MFWKRRASMRKNWFACGSCSKGASETEMTFEWNAVAEISALRIVECLVEGTLVTIFAQRLLAFSRRQVLQPVFLDLNESVRRMDTMLGRLVGDSVELCSVLRSD